MDDFEENYFNFHIGEEDYYPEKNNENFYNENNKIDEQKIISTGENHNSKKNDLNENNLLNGQNILYSNIEEVINIEKNSDCKNIINDAILMNSEIFQENNKIEFLNLNRETYNSQYNTVNGKQIITTNEMITNKFQELFNNPEINVKKLEDMQMIKKKRKRRTKKQIEIDKTLSHEEKVEKKRGRIKKNSKPNLNIKINHPKDADDNIIKKINTFFSEQIREWLNKSFLDETMNDFQTIKYRKKNNKGIFMKLSPKLISTQIKKELMMKIMDTKFKDIFYSNEISLKYKKINPNTNKILIDQIYKEGKQYFLIFILEMTFLEGLNYFNGQIPDETIIKYFKDNYNASDELIQKFIGNFGKIGQLLDKLYKKKEDKDDDETKDYLTKINVLCLNYKQSFDKKYIRGESKKNKDVNGP